MDPVDYLSNLPGKIPVAVNLTAVDGKTIKRNGTLFITDPPEVEIGFPDDSSPEPGSIDMKSDCLVFIEIGDIVTLICAISDNPANGRLRIRVKDLVNQSEKREFFRVAAEELTVFYKSRTGSVSEESPMSRARGVNISCSGVMVATERPLQKKERLTMEIYLPSPVEKSVLCEGTVVRVGKIKNSFFAGVKFEDLHSGICDDIVRFCFAQQRRILREHVVTKNI